MELVLTVITAPPQANIAGQNQVFAAAGGTLGRAADNSWVLADPDRVISSHHATINCLNGQFLLIDHSTNGTFVNGSELPLGQGNSVLLKEGDYFAIGGFQFLVGLRQQAASRPAPGLGGSFLDQLAPSPADIATPVPGMTAPAASANLSDGLDDLDKWLEPASPAAATSPWSGQAPTASGPLPFEQQSSDSDPLALLNARTPASDNDWLGTAPSTASAADDDWWQGSQPDNAPVDQQSVHIPAHIPTPEPAGDAVDIDALLGLPAEPPAAPPPPEHSTATQPVTIPPPAPPPAASAIPPVSAAVPPPVQSTSVNTHAADRRLAAQLGLQQFPDDQVDALTDTVAAVVRETAERLIDILRARSSIKNELRLERTMIGANENNPLKFSPRAEEALSYMFEHRGGAFLHGEAAIRDSFDDLADHQVAVLAGMRAAYEAMLAEFDPARLEQRLNSGGSLLSNRNARRWEAYQEYYARLGTDPESSYSRLFGETFARAYEAQINELKAARNFNRDH